MLRSARKRAGLTQAAVARRMGTTQSVISRAESLRGPSPTVAFLERFALATGETLAPLIKARHEPPVEIAAGDVLWEAKRLRRMARREGCVWIAVAGAAPEGAGAGTTTANTPSELRLVVRLWPAARGGEAVTRVERAAGRAFSRPVRVLDLDALPAATQAAVYRSRHNLAPGLVNAQTPIPLLIPSGAT